MYFALIFVSLSYVIQCGVFQLCIIIIAFMQCYNSHGNDVVTYIYELTFHYHYFRHRLPEPGQPPLHSCVQPQ